MAIDIAGTRSGRLVAIDLTDKRLYGCIVWLCKCDCGNWCFVRGASLKDGHTRSCGCLRTILPDMYNTRERIDPWRSYFETIHIRIAKARGYQNELTFEQFKELSLRNCFYCGALPRKNARGIVRNGIDRKDNSIGYLMDNCVTCCLWCNRTKSTRSSEEFEQHALSIVLHRGLGKSTE